MRRPHSRRRGLTLLEMVVLGSAVAVVLLFLWLGVSTTIDHRRKAETWTLLRQLDRAVQTYHDITTAWPVREPGVSSRPGEDPDDASPIVATLTALPESRKVLDGIPLDLRGRVAGSFEPIHDSWGTPLHCLTATSPDLIDRHAVAANGGKPVFISASEDGLFTDPDGSAAADNQRSDELPPASH